MIQPDDNGWINPTCPHCECVMEFNYHRWTTSSFLQADFNLYCRRCNYAVSITPATTDDSLKRKPNVIEEYNPSDFAQGEEE